MLCFFFFSFFAQPRSIHFDAAQNFNLARGTRYRPFTGLGSAYSESIGLFLARKFFLVKTLQICLKLDQSDGLELILYGKEHYTESKARSKLNVSRHRAMDKFSRIAVLGIQCCSTHLFQPTHCPPRCRFVFFFSTKLSRTHIPLVPVKSHPFHHLSRPRNFKPIFLPSNGLFPRPGRRTRSSHGSCPPLPNSR